MEILYILGALLLLFVMLVIAYEFGEIAGMKGHERGKYAVYTVLFGIVGMLMVIALPDMRKKEQNVPAPSPFSQKPVPTQTQSQRRWRCNHCGNMISQLPCTHCGAGENKDQAD